MPEPLHTPNGELYATRPQNGNGSDTAHVPDPETGEVLPACQRCAGVNVGDVELLQRENRKLMRKIRTLEHDAEQKRQVDPDRALIQSLIERWKKATNHPRSNANAADRFDIVRARLNEGYTAEQLELAIDGIGAYPYVVQGQRRSTGTPGQRHDRLGIALGSGEAVERFANLGYESRRHAD